MLNYILEGAIFVYTRLTNYTCRILQTCNTVFLLRDKLVTNVVIRATMCFNLQCNNVGEKLEKTVVRITGPLITSYNHSSNSNIYKLKPKVAISFLEDEIVFKDAIRKCRQKSYCK